MRGVLLSSLLLWSTIASAADIPPAAKVHFDLAQQAYDIGEYARAIDEYKRAYEIYPSAAALFAIAQVCRETKDYQCALHFYRQYIERAPDDGRFQADAKRLSAEVERAIAAAVSPPTGPMKPEQDKAALPATVKPTTPSEPQTVYRHLTLGLGAAIAGVVVAVAGGGLMGYAGSLHNNANSSATEGARDAQLNDADSARLAGGILLGVGTAAVIVGAIVILVGRERKSSATAWTQSSPNGFIVAGKF